MKKYFLQTGIAQEGPFSLEELRSKHLTKETPVWYEGLSGWTKIEYIAELKSLLESVPSRFVGHLSTPSPVGSTAALLQPSPDKEARILARVLQAVGIIGTAMLLLKELSRLG